jgi:integrase
MASTINRLTVKFCDDCGPGQHHDGLGLYLLVNKSLAKSWAFRFKRDGLGHWMGLGSYNDYTLNEARKRRRQVRQLHNERINPIESRRAERAAAAAEAAKRVTFSQAAEGYIKDNRASWRSEVHARQWKQTLRDFVLPTLGPLPVGAIETGHITKLLRPIWETKPETAKRVQGRIEAILDWSTANGFRSGENPGKWKGHLQNILPKRDKLATVTNHKALPVPEMPGFFNQLTKTGGTAARAIEAIILTSARVDEVLGAKWSEIDLAAGVWTLPAVSASNRRGRTKNGREHLVPLTPHLVALLKALSSNREPTAPVFKVGRTTLRDLMKRLLPGNTPTIHGFRACFRTWCGEHRPDAAGTTAEAALGHAKADKLEGTYDRSTRLRKRRKLMAQWEAYCLGAR